jgi:hypothetical protein
LGEVSVVPRHNDNAARSKSQNSRIIPVSTDLIRLWGDYLYSEYGDLDSDYVFVNLFAEPHGRALVPPVEVIAAPSTPEVSTLPWRRPSSQGLSPPTKLETYVSG